MSDHTAGPWQVKNGGTICYHVVSEDTRFQTGCISFDGRGHANAHLIAAAPELLAALKLLWLDASEACGWSDEYALRINDVIAKAEGREP